MLDHAPQIAKELGIPLADNVIASWRTIAADCGVPRPVTVAGRPRRQAAGGEEGQAAS